MFEAEGVLLVVVVISALAEEVPVAFGLLVFELVGADVLFDVLLAGFEVYELLLFGVHLGGRMARVVLGMFWGDITGPLSDDILFVVECVCAIDDEEITAFGFLEIFSLEAVVE